MREIEFRAKLLNSGEWVYGSLLNIEDTYFIIEKGDFDFDYRTENSAFWFDCTEKEVNPATVGQFTGLHDKNGKRVYEGDILIVRRYDNDFMSESEEFRDAFSIDELKGNEIETITDCVVYEEASFYVGDLYLCALFGNQKHSNPIHEFEVIGNVHDNPELLGKEER